ncbi:MAG: hypothetical protein OEM46_00685 [Ignavibacteria bacterium]|nr:hypothetical protein [Ignavibacteria bacterium]
MKYHSKTEVKRLYRKFESWRKVAEEIGFGTGAYWNLIASGKRQISNDAKKTLKQYLGIKSKSNLIMISARIDKGLYKKLNDLKGNRSKHIQKALEDWLSIK